MGKMKFLSALAGIIFIIIFAAFGDQLFAQLEEPIGDETAASVPESVQSPLFPVLVHGKWGFIDNTGNIVVDPQFEYARSFSEGFAAVLVGDKYGYIDEIGNIAIEPQFTHCLDFSEGFAGVQIDGEEGQIYGNWTYIDTEGNILLDPTFNMTYGFRNGLGMVEVPDGLTISGAITYGLGEGASDRESIQVPAYGWIDKSGKYVIEPDKYILAWPFTEGLAFVQDVSGNQGYIDESGKIVIELGLLALQFSEGLAAVLKGERWAFIDTTGKIVIEPNDFTANSSSMFSDGVAAVKIDDKWCYINKSGEVVITPEREVCFCGVFCDGVALIQVGKTDSGKWGFMDRTGKFVIEPKFDWVKLFHDGLAQVRLGDTESGKYGYIDRAGNYVWEPTK